MIVFHKSKASPAEPASSNNIHSFIFALRHDEFEPTSSIVPPPFPPPPLLLLLDVDVLALEVEVEDCLTSEVLLVDMDDGAFGLTVVTAIMSEVVVAAPLADRMDVIWTVDEGVNVVVIAMLLVVGTVVEGTVVSALGYVLIATVVVKEYDPPLLCPGFDPPRAFGQSTPVPWFWKNDPINVFG